jgi:hypothetical protein
MNVHLPKYRILKKVLWDEKYLQPIVDVMNNILLKYKNKKDYIQEILELRELILEADIRLIRYCVSDKYDRHFVRLIEDKVTDDMRYLIFNIYNDVVMNNPLEDVPNVIVLEYCIFREIYLKQNIIDKDYGINITEKDYLNNTLIPRATEDDYSLYVLDKHFPHIRYQIMEYIEDETNSQEIINSIYDYQKELIEMCRMNISVEDTYTYTHPSYEFSLHLIPSVAKQILPMFSEILAIELEPSST